MDCIQPGICNCVSDCSCDNGYVCCSQNVPKGKATYGMCVKQGFCDNERGIPMKSCKNSNSKNNRSDGVREPFLFREGFHEGYSDQNETCNCKDWNKAMIILTIIILFLLLLVLGKVFQSGR